MGAKVLNFCSYCKRRGGVKAKSRIFRYIRGEHFIRFGTVISNTLAELDWEIIKDDIDDGRKVGRNKPSIKNCNGVGLVCLSDLGRVDE